MFIDCSRTISCSRLEYMMDGGMVSMPRNFLGDGLDISGRAMFRVCFGLDRIQMVMYAGAYVNRHFRCSWRGPIDRYTCSSLPTRVTELSTYIHVRLQRCTHM